MLIFGCFCTRDYSALLIRLDNGFLPIRVTLRMNLLAVDIQTASQVSMAMVWSQHRMPEPAVANGFRYIYAALLFGGQYIGDGPLGDTYFGKYF